MLKKTWLNCLPRIQEYYGSSIQECYVRWVYTTNWYRKAMKLDRIPWFPHRGYCNDNFKMGTQWWCGPTTQRGFHLHPPFNIFVSTVKSWFTNDWFRLTCWSKLFLLMWVVLDKNELHFIPNNITPLETDLLLFSMFISDKSSKWMRESVS